MVSLRWWGKGSDACAGSDDYFSIAEVQEEISTATINALAEVIVEVLPPYPRNQPRLSEPLTAQGRPGLA